jgi:RNA polymerase sigma factor (TIGR02999 family)
MTHSPDSSDADTDETAAVPNPAVDALVPVVYEELRAIAHRALRAERPDHTLDTTALVHEAYLRLLSPGTLAASDRTRFLGAASVAMRRVLIDYARAHRSEKRWGGKHQVSLSAITDALDGRAETLIALDESLTALAERRPRLALVVQCRYFGGLTEEETALYIGITPRTVQRDWVKAKAWLAYDLRGEWVENAS